MDGFKKILLSIVLAVVLLVIGICIIGPVLALWVGNNMAVILSPMLVLIILVIYDIMKK